MNRLPNGSPNDLLVARALEWSGVPVKGEFLQSAEVGSSGVGLPP
jgi:hypothetical protein